MGSVFLGKLVNGVFGDPALYITLRHTREALLLDLGQLDALSPRELLAVRAIYVTHCHLDHFIGFDRLLRVALARPRRLRLTGPARFIHHVHARLQSYVWNLADRFEEGLELDVTEVVAPDQGRRTLLRLADGFALGPIHDVPLPGGLVHTTPRYTARAAILDHNTPCLGYALEEPVHLGVRSDAVQAAGLSIGPWLSDLKAAVRAGLPDDTPIPVPQGPPRPLAALRPLLVQRPGQKLAYVTDVIFHPDNVARITALAHRADVFYVESSFRAADADRARQRFHLTSAQAGTLAALSQARTVVPFHFSPRHEDEEDALRAEVLSAFMQVDGGLGELPPAAGGTKNNRIKKKII